HLLQTRARHGVARGELPDERAHFVDPAQCLLLTLRSRPLHEAAPVVIARVPGAGVHPHAPASPVRVEILGEERRPEPSLPFANALEQRLIELAEEAPARRGVAEPPPVVAVAARGHERRKVAPLRALGNLLEEPVGIHAGLLSVRQLPIAHDDDDALSSVLRDVWPVAELLPAHRLEWFDVLAVHDHELVAETPEQRDELLGESELRRPEAPEPSPEQVLADAPPALELQRPVRLRNQRQNGMVVRRPEDSDDGRILEVPEQVPAFDDAVDATLELGARQRPEHGPREAQVHFPAPLVAPE